MRERQLEAVMVYADEYGYFWMQDGIPTQMVCGILRNHASKEINQLKMLIDLYWYYKADMLDIILFGEPPMFNVKKLSETNKAELDTYNVLLRRFKLEYSLEYEKEQWEQFAREKI